MGPKSRLGLLLLPHLFLVWTVLLILLYYWKNERMGTRLSPTNLIRWGNKIHLSDASSGVGRTEQECTRPVSPSQVPSSLVLKKKSRLSPPLTGLPNPPRYLPSFVSTREHYYYSEVANNYGSVSGETNLTVQTMQTSFMNTRSRSKGQRRRWSHFTKTLPPAPLTYTALCKRPLP